MGAWPRVHVLQLELGEAGDLTSGRALVRRNNWLVKCLSQPKKTRYCNAVFNDETTYTYLASFQRAVRARRGDNARAERCLRVGCDKTS